MTRSWRIDASRAGAKGARRWAHISRGHALSLLARAGLASWRLRLLLALLWVGVWASVAACAGESVPEAALSDIARPYRFSLARWELAQFARLLQPAELPPQAQGDPSGYVQHYFALQAWANNLERAGQPLPPSLGEELERMCPAVERILAQQVREAFRREGIYSPLDRYLPLPITFPPVWFVLEPPPQLLVVSPRERIEPIYQVMLVPKMDVATMEQIEAQVEALGYSALVTEIGGLGASYPAMVSTYSSLPYAVETVAEEWLHQYLAFTPSGFRYILHLLRLRPDYEIAQLNESLATVVHEEIGAWVLAEYYGILPEPEPAALPDEAAGDFCALMRETRLQAEALLAQGQIEAAEAYMEARRQVLVEKGYRIRKLNQAYFAFYGTYADAPGAISLVGSELRALRAEAPSLGAFLNLVVGMTSREELQQLLQTFGIRSARLLPPALIPAERSVYAPQNRLLSVGLGSPRPASRL